MKLYEVIVLKPERIVVKTVAKSSKGIDHVMSNFVADMEPCHGIAPVLHSVRRIKDVKELKKPPISAA